MPGFDFFGIPKRGALVEVSDWLGGASLGSVGCPCGWFDVAVLCALLDPPEGFAGVLVDDDWGHRCAISFLYLQYMLRLSCVSAAVNGSAMAIASGVELIVSMLRNIKSRPTLASLLVVCVFMAVVWGRCPVEISSSYFDRVALFSFLFV